MTRIIGWEHLWCAKCESKIFHEVKHLKWSETGGCVSEPAGWRCDACGLSVDTAKLIGSLKIKLAKERIKELEDQIGNT